MKVRHVTRLSVQNARRSPRSVSRRCLFVNIWLTTIINHVFYVVSYLLITFGYCGRSICNNFSFITYYYKFKTTFIIFSLLVYD